MDEEKNAVELVTTEGDKSTDEQKISEQQARVLAFRIATEVMEKTTIAHLRVVHYLLHGFISGADALDKIEAIILKGLTDLVLKCSPPENKRTRRQVRTKLRKILAAS